MLTPFVKPRQVLSYLDVASAKKVAKLAQDCMRVSRLFVSETRKNRLREYLVSVSRGAPHF